MKIDYFDLSLELGFKNLSTYSERARSNIVFPVCFIEDHCVMVISRHTNEVREITMN